jgi:hypothetical protein
MKDPFSLTVGYNRPSKKSRRAVMFLAEKNFYLVERSMNLLSILQRRAAKSLISVRRRNSLLLRV